MRVIEKLNRDYHRYGSCQYLEINHEDVYAIERLPPWMSSVEVRQVMDEIEHELFR